MPVSNSTAIKSISTTSSTWRKSPHSRPSKASTRTAMARPPRRNSRLMAYPKQHALLMGSPSQSTAKMPDVALLETSVQRLPGQGGLDILRLVAVYSMPSPESGVLANLTFEDRNYTDRVGWKEIVVRPSAGAHSDRRTGALLVEQSNGLLEYPAETLSSAPDMRRAVFAFEGGTGGIGTGIRSRAAGRGRTCQPPDLQRSLARTRLPPGCCCSALWRPSASACSTRSGPATVRPSSLPILSAARAPFVRPSYSARPLPRPIHRPSTSLDSSHSRRRVSSRPEGPALYRRRRWPDDYRDGPVALSQSCMAVHAADRRRWKPPPRLLREVA